MSDYLDLRGLEDIPGVGETVDLDTVGRRAWLRENMEGAVMFHNRSLLKELFVTDEQFLVAAAKLKLADKENKVLTKYILKLLCELQSGEPITIIDFGGSAIEKVDTIVRALEEGYRECRYFVAGNCCLSVLRAVKAINAVGKYVRASGLHGTATQVLEWAQKYIKGPLLFISLGSTITNYEPWIQRSHLREWAKISSGMIVSQDAPCLSHVDGESIANKEHMVSFVRYGLWRCNSLLPHPTLLEKHWLLSCEIKNRPFRHSWFLFAKKDFPSWAGTIFKGHKIECYVAFKYTEEEMRANFQEEGLNLLRVFKEPDDPTRIYYIDGERSWYNWKTEASRPEWSPPEFLQ